MFPILPNGPPGLQPGLGAPPVGPQFPSTDPQVAAMLLGPLQQAQQQDQQALVAQQAQAGQVALAQMLANQPNQQALMATSTPLPVPTAAAAPSDQTNGALV